MKYKKRDEKALKFRVTLSMLIIMFIWVLIIPQKGMNESILVLLINNPSKGVIFLIIIVICIFPGFFLISWIIDKVFK